MEGEPLTLLRCSQQNHEAVVTLQFVEVRPYLDLVFCSALQVRQDDAVVRGGFHVLDQPGAADGAVKDTVALNVTRQTGHLGTKRMRRTDEFTFLTISTAAAHSPSKTAGRWWETGRQASADKRTRLPAPSAPACGPRPLPSDCRLKRTKPKDKKRMQFSKHKHQGDQRLFFDLQDWRRSPCVLTGSEIGLGSLRP